MPNRILTNKENFEVLFQFVMTLKKFTNCVPDVNNKIIGDFLNKYGAKK